MSTRQYFIDYLCKLWTTRDTGNWGTSTFKLRGTNDTWLSVSNSETGCASIIKWDNSPKWIHLVSIDMSRKKQMYPMAVPYDANSYREKIEILVSQVPTDHFKERVEWLQEYC